MRLTYNMFNVSLSLSLYIYIYIYTHTYPDWSEYHSEVKFLE